MIHIVYINSLNKVEDINIIYEKRFITIFILH